MPNTDQEPRAVVVVKKYVVISYGNQHLTMPLAEASDLVFQLARLQPEDADTH
jgi:hypothetical protein